MLVYVNERVIFSPSRVVPQKLADFCPSKIFTWTKVFFIAQKHDEKDQIMQLLLNRIIIFERSTKL
jgi:hypothetical protein